MIYYGIFSSILTYGCQIWGQKDSVVKKLQILQNKALRIMNFYPSRSSATPLFKKCKILKLSDYISLQNFLYAYNSIRGNLPSSLSGQVSFVKTGKNTRSEIYFQLNKIVTNTILYGTNSIKSKSVEIWNYVNRLFRHENLPEKSRIFCKQLVTIFLIGI